MKTSELLTEAEEQKMYALYNFTDKKYCLVKGDSVKMSGTPTLMDKETAERAFEIIERSVEYYSEQGPKHDKNVGKIEKQIKTQEMKLKELENLPHKEAAEKIKKVERRISNLKSKNSSAKFQSSDVKRGMKKYKKLKDDDIAIVKLTPERV